MTAEKPEIKEVNIYQKALAVLIILVAVIYTLGVVLGLIPAERKIDSVNLAIIAFSVLVVILLLRPGLLDRLRILRMPGFELEMLEKVKEKQAEQENRINELRLILPLLLPESERNHLLNLAEGKTSNYEGKHSLRAELRHLRSMGLIKMVPGKHVGDITDGSKVDLSQFVEITDDFGKRWIERIKEINLAEKLG